MDLFTLMGKIVIESGESTTEIDNMIAKAQSLSGLLGGTTNTAENTSKSLVASTKSAATGVGKAVSTMQIALGNLATQGFNKLAGYGKDFFQTGFEFNQNMEKWTASFKTYMGGDLEKAQAFMEEVRQFAIDTPLSLESSVQSAVRLMASGIESNEIIDKLRMLGDIANGDTEKMSRLGLVLSQVLSAKKLKGNDPNQFKEAGVPIYELLLDYYHANGYDYIDSAFLMEMQAKGGITSDEVLGALEMATSSGGLYYNAMNNIMDTEYGKAQKMKDAYEQAAGAATKALFAVFSSDTIPALSNILEQLNEWATENPEALKNLSQAFSDFATTGLSGLLDGLTGLIDFWNEHQGAFQLMTSILGGLLMVTGHPAAGLAMLVASGASGTEGLEDVYKNADGSYKTNILFPGLSEQMNDSLPNGDKEAGRYSYFSENAREVAESLWDMQRLGLTGADVPGFESLMAQVYAEFGKIATDLGVEDTEYGVTSLLTDLVQQMMTLDKNKEDLPDDWFYDPEKREPETDWMMKPINPETGLPGDNMANSLKQLNENMHNMSMLFASASGMPARATTDSDGVTMTTWAKDVAAELSTETRRLNRFGTASFGFDDGGSGVASIQALAATVQSLAGEVRSLTGTIPEAIASGISGITVTGTVTTGNVVLSTGTIVGQLAPRLNLALGALGRLSGRGG